MPPIYLNQKTYELHPMHQVAEHIDPQIIRTVLSYGLLSRDYRDWNNNGQPDSNADEDGGGGYWDQHLTGGQIAGIVLGSFFTLLIILSILYCAWLSVSPATPPKVKVAVLFVVVVVTLFVTLFFLRPLSIDSIKILPVPDRFQGEAREYGAAVARIAAPSAAILYLGNLQIISSRNSPTFALNLLSFILSSTTTPALKYLSSSRSV
ncbi:uncharacterized protein BCR38DRAFT_512589 [Pseudomassariella vexata]|uniref:Uncharacterized protein n=1 Tax=Pseudomassariella vexata TaxID=1141098 RepID=A0A1Y2E4L8_9PEZI|nr:uncharacterized protein BCR38DRAFT_512589 [Pseudomassariella vexata]ORY66498.1 hypothetical protein BCR38DRAFT_512589 [Pseudomassariella vexata]